MKKEQRTLCRKTKPRYGNRQPNYNEFKQLLEDAKNMEINKEWENDGSDLPFRMPIKTWVQQQLPFPDIFEVDQPKLNGQFKNKYENDTTNPKNEGGQNGDNDQFTTFPDYL